MSATVTELRPTPRRSRQHPAVRRSLDERLLRLSARLAAHSITLRDATAEIHDLYVRSQGAAARTAAAGMPERVAHAFIVASVTRTALEVAVDEERSAIPIARAERRLGEVLVLPCGRTEGARPKQAPTHPRDLW